MIVQLLTEYHLEFLSLKEGCRGSSKPALVKMAHCWKYHGIVHLLFCKNDLFTLYIFKTQSDTRYNRRL